MCDYCQNFKSFQGIEGKDYFNVHLDILTAYDKTTTGVITINKYFDLGDLGTADLTEDIEINFCPFCGRKLTTT